MKSFVPNHTANELGRQDLVLESGILNTILSVFSNTVLSPLSECAVVGVRFLRADLSLCFS